VVGLGLSSRPRTPNHRTPPAHPTLRGMSHHALDTASLEMARRIAAGLGTHPEWLTHARNNLQRWQSRNADAPGLVRCYQEWLAILDLPVDEIRRRLVDPSEEGQRLRQSSPFAGVLPPREVWAIKKSSHEPNAT